MLANLALAGLPGVIGVFGDKQAHLASQSFGTGSLQDGRCLLRRAYCPRSGCRKHDAIPATDQAFAERVRVPLLRYVTATPIATTPMSAPTGSRITGRGLITTPSPCEGLYS